MNFVEYYKPTCYMSWITEGRRRGWGLGGLGDWFDLLGVCFKRCLQYVCMIVIQNTQEQIRVDMMDDMQARGSQR